MKVKQFSKVLKHDLIEGITDNLPKYIIVFLLFLFTCGMFLSNISSLETKGSILDFAIYIYKGMEVYVYSPDNHFRLPMIWLMTQVLVAFLIIGYPNKDMYTYGVQVLVRTKRKLLWWTAKCIWNAVSVIIFYAVGFLTIFLFALTFGKVSFQANDALNIAGNQIDTSNINYFSLVFAVFFLPVITSVALSLFQMALSYIIKPIFSYMIIIILSVASAFYCSPFLIGNYSMLLRNNIAFPDGISNKSAVMGNVLLIIISFLIGGIYLSRCDILKKN